MVIYTLAALGVVQSLAEIFFKQNTTVYIGCLQERYRCCHCTLHDHTGKIQGIDENKKA